MGPWSVPPTLGVVALDTTSWCPRATSPVSVWAVDRALAGAATRIEVVTAPLPAVGAPPPELAVWPQVAAAVEALAGEVDAVVVAAPLPWLVATSEAVGVLAELAVPVVCADLTFERPASGPLASVLSAAESRHRRFVLAAASHLPAGCFVCPSPGVTERGEVHVAGRVRLHRTGVPHVSTVGGPPFAVLDEQGFRRLWPTVPTPAPGSLVTWDPPPLDAPLSDPSGSLPRPRPLVPVPVVTLDAAALGRAWIVDAALACPPDALVVALPAHQTAAMAATVQTLAEAMPVVAVVDPPCGGTSLPATPRVWPVPQMLASAAAAKASALLAAGRPLEGMGTPRFAELFLAPRVPVRHG